MSRIARAARVPTTAHRDGTTTMPRSRARARSRVALALACACACVASRVARARAFDDAWLDAVEDDFVDEPRGDFEFAGAGSDARDDAAMAMALEGDDDDARDAFDALERSRTRRTTRRR